MNMCIHAFLIDVSCSSYGSMVRVCMLNLYLFCHVAESWTPTRAQISAMHHARCFNTSFWEPWPQGFLLEYSLTENMVQTCLVALYPVDKAWLVTGRTPRWWELKLTFSNFRAFHRGTFMKMPEIHENAQIPSNSMESSWNMGGFQLSFSLHV